MKLKPMSFFFLTNCVTGFSTNHRINMKKVIIGCNVPKNIVPDMTDADILADPRTIKAIVADFADSGTLKVL